jgi:hypothetical protein
VKRIFGTGSTPRHALELHPLFIAAELGPGMEIDRDSFCPVLADSELLA